MAGISAIEAEIITARLKAGKGLPGDMAATLAVRRQDVVVRGMSIRRMKKEYPYLFSADGVSLCRERVSEELVWRLVVFSLHISPIVSKTRYLGSILKHSVNFAQMQIIDIEGFSRR